MTDTNTGGLTLHRLRKIEIVVLAEDHALVEALLDGAGVGGWTMIRDVAGMGHGGFHQGKSIFNDQSGLVMFVGVAEAIHRQAHPLSPAVTPSLLGQRWRASATAGT